MISNFEKIRNKLHKAIEIHGINSEITKKISNRYDQLVSSYYQNEKQFHKGSFMHMKYLESIEHLRDITTQFMKFPTVQEWNNYAKKNNLLSSESLKYISGNSWHNLRNKIL